MSSHQFYKNKTSDIFLDNEFAAIDYYINLYSNVLVIRLTWSFISVSTAIWRRIKCYFKRHRAYFFLKLEFHLNYYFKRLFVFN